MNALEMRDYIHSHLHQIDERSINEVFEKLRFLVEEKEPVIGYDVRTGAPLTQTGYKKEMIKRDKDIDGGRYITHEQLKKELKKW